MENGPLRQFQKTRVMEDGKRCRRHLEIPIAFLHDQKRRHTLTLPPEVVTVYEGLYSAAVKHVRSALLPPPDVGPAPLTRELLEETLLSSITVRSVLRLIRYDEGVGSRPHVDPGLCTALLLGSTGGLELNTTDDVSELLKGNAPGDYRLPSSDSKGASARAFDDLPHWQTVPDSPAWREDTDTVIMNSNFLSVLTLGEQSGVLHRVVDHWGKEGGVRTNVIVELRPHKPKFWYQWSSGRAKKKS
ncbi:hypothetical protein AGDE_07703 [Angomonas deanei]|uniref:2OG-Fe(II) oxygenase superfamily n=1 Tax=Angomonas deanei TaxID=59799 RepID=A0A7G2CHP5_9TRYP|nr:hypothetical protein AGDE_07703 [Angomonas deanei]CAD2219276.1 hypothetical protein, conserved [Angomonas deanei]|eukprot:EPY34933.1 hypothetical protein AGDE_07703 [Angomonas deanei]